MAEPFPRRPFPPSSRSIFEKPGNLAMGVLPLAGQRIDVQVHRVGADDRAAPLRIGIRLMTGSLEVRFVGLTPAELAAWAREVAELAELANARLEMDRPPGESAS